MEGMERLHSRIRLLWAAGALLTAVVLAALVTAIVVFALSWPLQEGLLLGGGVALVLFVVGVVFAVLRYRAWRFELQDDALYLERGVVTEIRTVLPYVRVQHVDTQRNPIERVLGLSRVVVYTAGSRGADVAVPGLTADRATALREDLRTRASEHDGGDGV